ncbi:MAG TPA: protein kinase [Chloroflexota bacterium]|nr:protein kinase [Chloroflexota bacterium]
MDLLAGRRLGPYELYERLGAGGMGVVHRAVHRRLNQPRAVKVLPANLAADPLLVERFEREARLAAELRHPHIVPIYDVDDHDGIHYIAMELLEGHALRQLILEDAPLALDRCLWLLRQLADALDFAHRRGVAHRDVKPGNVFVGPDDHVTLVDFGIARAVEEARLTQTGGVVGTSEYMSPEVARGGEHGIGSDLYAIGVVSYELVTGRVPFTGPNSATIMYAQIHTPPPPPRSLRPDLPAAVEAVILRQLHKDSTQRYPTALAFVEALAEAAAVREPAPIPPLQPEPVPAPPLPPVDIALPHLDDPASRADRPDSRIGPVDPAHATTHVLSGTGRIPPPPAGGGDAAQTRRSSRLPIVLGAVILALVALGGAFWGLRAGGLGPFADRQAAKPHQAVASPAASTAAPIAASPQAAKPAQVAASPAAKPAQAAASPVTNSVARLLRSDDFSDPARGLFRNNLEGIGRITGDGSAPLDFQGNYSYQGGALVGRLVGDHPGDERAVFGRMLLARDQVVEDFAVEVRARITSSPNVTRFGLQFLAAQGEYFTFTIHPGTTGFNISRTLGPQAQALTTGRTTAMRPPGEDNLIRVEVRGDTARLYVNGQEAGLTRHESLARRGGQVGLNMAATGQLANRTAEVQFREFKVFALSP